MNDETLVQPIFVDPTCPLDALLRNVMYVSAEAVIEDTRVVRAWLTSDYRKTVRSAKPSMMERLKAEDASTHEYKSALAYEPRHYDEFTKLMRRGQVSGWDQKVLPLEDPSPYDSPSAVLHISEQVIMSPGKLAAQAAHAGVFMARDYGIDSLLRINLVYSTILPEEGYVIRDNGHTEVEPDTHTVTLVPNL